MVIEMNLLYLLIVLEFLAYFGSLIVLGYGLYRLVQWIFG